MMTSASFVMSMMRWSAPVAVSSVEALRSTQEEGRHVALLAPAAGVELGRPGPAGAMLDARVDDRVQVDHLAVLEPVHAPVALGPQALEVPAHLGHQLGVPPQRLRRSRAPSRRAAPPRAACTSAAGSRRSGDPIRRTRRPPRRRLRTAARPSRRRVDLRRLDGWRAARPPGACRRAGSRRDRPAPRCHRAPAPAPRRRGSRRAGAAPRRRAGARRRRRRAPGRRAAASDVLEVGGRQRRSSGAPAAGAPGGRRRRRPAARRPASASSSSVTRSGRTPSPARR